jgi:hypothetical protein
MKGNLQGRHPGVDIGVLMLTCSRCCGRTKNEVSAREQHDADGQSRRGLYYRPMFRYPIAGVRERPQRVGIAPCAKFTAAEGETRDKYVPMWRG